MENIKIIRRLQTIQVKLESARSVLQDGKEIPCDRKLMGLQQIVAQLISDIVNDSPSIDTDDIFDNEDAPLEQSASNDE